ncbi:MAG: hypothetical protein D6706_15495, partial [Chloroflexi bacterium]
MHTFSAEEMAHAQAVLNSVRSLWLQRPGVTAIDLGFKWSKGEMTGKLAIRVHVERKRPLEELDEDERFPEEIDGVPVDVIEATYGVQLLPEQEQLEAAVDNRNQRFEEIPLGVSIGSPNVTAGTLGAKVFDADTGDELILSNWHVMAGAPNVSQGLAIWQPGRADGGNSADTFATLERWVLGPYDAAVARLTGERPVLTTTVEGDAIEDAAKPQLGMQVWKSGRTTGRTMGFIDGVMMTVPINYGAAGVQPIHDVFRIVPLPDAGNVEISLGGDSGSVWVDAESGKGVGLHFAGEVGNAPEHALAMDMVKVKEFLHIEFP